MEENNPNNIEEIPFKKKKGGRKPLHESDKKTKRSKLSLITSEYEFIERKRALTTHKTFAEYCHFLIVSKNSKLEVKSVLDIKSIMEIKKQTTLINEIVRKINVLRENNEAYSHDKLTDLVTEIYQKMWNLDSFIKGNINE